MPPRADLLEQLSALTTALRTARTLEEGLGLMLTATIELVKADFGNIQLRVPGTDTLRIAAHHGFSPAFLETFREVSVREPSACGRALASHSRVVIEDVEQDEPYAPYRQLARAQGYRAVQSTPLVGTNGDLLGMISTHTRAPGRPDAEALHCLDLYVGHAVAFIERIRAEAARARAELRQHELLAASLAAEAEATRRRAELAAALEAMADAVFIADATGHLVEVNEAFVRFHHFPDKAACRRALEEFTPLFDVRRPDGQPVPFDQWAVSRALRGEVGSDTEFHITRRDTGETWIGSYNFAPIRDTHGGLIGAVVVGRDITEHRREEAALRAMEAQRHDAAETLRLLFDGSAQGIVSVVEDGTIELANPALELMLGWPEGGLAGQPLSVLVPPSQREAHAQLHHDYWAQPRARHMGVGLRLEALRRDGTTVPVEISLTHVRTTGGARAFAFVSDISARRRAEDERRRHVETLEAQAQQLRRLASELTLAEQAAREQLAKSLHDHLQQILFSARLGLDRIATLVADGRSPDATLIANTRRGLDEAIHETRTFTRELLPAMLHDGGLPAAVAWLAEWARDRHGLLVRVSAASDATLVQRAANTLVFECVKELLFNVAKHAGTSEVHLDLARSGPDEVRVTVIDYGRGFEPADVFAAQGLRGTGLGLLSIRERLALFGGQLDIDAAPGRGARITLRVPRGAGAPDRPGAGDTDQTVDPTWTSHRTRIVIADDHALVRDGLRRLLEDWPEFEVVGEATTGREAVALADQLRPDVIVMDVSMPEMDGIEATRRIRERWPGVTIIGLSTEEKPEGLHAIERAGAAAYVSKSDDGPRLLVRLLGLHRDLARPGAEPAAG